MRTNLIPKEKPIAVEEKPVEVKEKPKKGKKTKASTDDGLLDYVIAFDTTSSMASYIEAVREHVKELIKDLLSTNPNLRIGIVAFGDYCDMESDTEFGKAYQRINLTRNEKALVNFVKTAQDTYGGDCDEFYELVIKKITEEFDWRPEAKKAVLLIADASPHEVGYTYHTRVVDNQIDWREEATKSAAKGIQWDTVSCGWYGHKWREELSKITGGIHAPFQTSDKTSEVVKAAAYSRGGDYTKTLFAATMDNAISSGDTELAAVYSAYSKKLTD